MNHGARSGGAPTGAPALRAPDDAAPFLTAAETARLNERIEAISDRLDAYDEPVWNFNPDDDVDPPDNARTAWTFYKRYTRPNFVRQNEAGETVLRDDLTHDEARELERICTSVENWLGTDVDAYVAGAEPAGTPPMWLASTLRHRQEYLNPGTRAPLLGGRTATEVMTA